ncbi:hypothetical protein ACOSP7_016583 [Xanthoceras sorbifolium]
MMLLLLANWGWRFAIVDALGKEHVQADNMVTNKQSAIVSFGKIEVRHLNFCSSDNQPVLISISNVHSGNSIDSVRWGRRFHFESCWVDKAECKDIIINA